MQNDLLRMFRYFTGKQDKNSLANAITEILLTLHPISTDGTQEVGIQTMRLLHFVQQLSDVHHLTNKTKP